MPLGSTSVLPVAVPPTLAGSADCASATPEPSATIVAAIATERIVLMPKLLGFPAEAVPASRVLIREASRTPSPLAIFRNARKRAKGPTSYGRAGPRGSRPTAAPASPACPHGGCGRRGAAH